MKRSRAELMGLLAATGLMAACGSDADGFDYDPEPYYDASGASDTGYSYDTATEEDAGMATDTGSTPTEDVFIPEEEVVIAPIAPVASENYVFVANADFNSVAKIDSVTLSVTPIAVERHPTVIRTVPGTDIAVVLNTASDSVSIVSASPTEDLVESVDILPGCNAMVLSPDGRYAVAYYDNAQASDEDRIGSLQDVELIDVEGRVSYELSVGFHVREVLFSDDGTLAFVLSDDGMTRIPLAEIDGDRAMRTIEVTEDRLPEYVDVEVTVSADGSLAIVRNDRLAGVDRVDLVNGARDTITLPGIPTDLDLTEEGVVVAALRDAGMVAFFDVHAEGDDEVELITTDGTVPAGVLTMSGDEQEAIVYTTLGDDLRLGVLDIDGDDAGTITPWFLRKGVRALAAGPDGASFLVVHSTSGEPVRATDSLDERIANSEAMSVINIDTRGSKFVLLDTAPDAFVFSEDGGHVFVMLGDEALGVKRIEWINLASLRRTTVEMTGLPESIGTVPGTGRVFVSQASDSGRLSFIDPADGAVYNVAAYQLNTYIE